MPKIVYQGFKRTTMRHITEYKLINQKTTTGN